MNQLSEKKIGLTFDPTTVVDCVSASKTFATMYALYPLIQYAK